MTPFQTDYLLKISRLPDHFYAMVYCLEGRDAIYQNPGTSLRSYVVTRIRDELVELPEHLHEAVRECEEFNSSVMTIKTIVELLMSRAQAVIEELNETSLETVNGTQVESYVARATELHTLATTIKTQYETLAINLGLNEPFDFTSIGAQIFKQNLINLQYMIEQT